MKRAYVIMAVVGVSLVGCAPEQPELPDVELVDSATAALLPPGNIHNKRVFHLIYNPYLPARGYNLATHCQPGRGCFTSPSAIESYLVNRFSFLTGGRLNYSVVERQEVNAFPPRNSNPQWTEDLFFYCYDHMTADPHWSDPQCVKDAPWESILATYDVCGRLNRNEIDEFWISTAPITGFYESALAGPAPGFPYNGPVLTGTSCSKLMPLMAFSYERNEVTASHNWGHRMEATMTKVYGGWVGDNPTPNNWEKYGMVKWQSPSFPYAGCGSIHYAPNARSAADEYVYNVVDPFPTTCLDFNNYPNLGNPSTTAVSATCAAWGCTEEGYYTWWFGHLPSFAGSTGGKLNDWWAYLVDPNLAMNLPTPVPTPPTNVVAGALSPTSIGVSWTDSSDNETSFYLSNGVTGVTLPANSSSYTWTGVAPGTYMCFYLQAINAAGPSAWSTQGCTTTPALPAVPTNVNATPLNGTQIRVGWTDNSSNESGFELSNGVSVVSLPPNTISYTWSGLSPGSYNCFYVRALIPGGASAWSSQACTSTFALPAAPTGPTATSLNGTQLRINWTDASNNEQGFEVNNGTSSVTLGAGVNTYTWSGLSPGTSMCFRVRSYNQAGASAWTANACATTMALPPAPGSPTATALNGTQIRINWGDTASNESGFEVHNGVTSIVVGPNTTTYTWSGLSPGTYMCFRVRTYNLAGYSAWTGYACATTITLPAMPTGQLATPINANSIRVTWNDVSANEQGFEVNNGVSSVFYGAGVNNITWGGLAAGTYMCFRVRSYNQAGQSAWTPYTCTTTPAPPAAPTGQLATPINANSIRVTWNDNSSNEQGFEVNNGVSSVFYGANVRNITWGGLASRTYMCFHVRSYNAAGYSAWTPWACTTTP